MIFVCLATLVLTLATLGIAELFFGKELSTEQIEDTSMFFFLSIGIVPLTVLAYSVLALMIYNATAGWFDWPQLWLPWWQLDKEKVGVALSSRQVVVAFAAIYMTAIAWLWFSWRKPS